MKAAAVIPCVLCACAAGSVPEQGVWYDPAGDAVVRRTDAGNDAPLPDGFEPIDLLKVKLRGWTSPTPDTDPYCGSDVASMADLFRIDVTLAGLVCPPGPVGVGGFGFEPHRHGARPLFGTVDLDIDDDRDSGGELYPAALFRYLANVGRFGLIPAGSVAERMIRDGGDVDGSFSTGPQFERTGAEFSLVFCGCGETELLSGDDDADLAFSPGETWLVRGRFFERFQAFQVASGLFGGSDNGLFDPKVELRFSHDPCADQTTVTMVFPITMAGAAMLAGEPEEPLDFSLLNHTSLFEALDDLVFGVYLAEGDVVDLVEPWEHAELADFRKPQSWYVTALLGTAPTEKQNGPAFVWTDTGFNEVFGDLDCDGAVTGADAQLIEQAILCDWDDGVDDGRVQIEGFSAAFDVRDLDGNGVIDLRDRAAILCPADQVEPFGVVNFFDVSRFLANYTEHNHLANLADDDLINFFDVSLFLHYYNACR